MSCSSSRFSGRSSSSNLFRNSSLDRLTSPNAEEALSLLGLPLPPTKIAVESAALSLLRLSSEGPDCVIIRSGHLGAYIFSGQDDHGQWVDAYWGPQDAARIVDVTGAGNAFLGGLAAGLALCEGNVHQGMFAGSPLVPCERSRLCSCSIRDDLRLVYYRAVGLACIISAGR
jgi:hypothetical protein